MLRSLCWKSAPWAGAGPATFESPQQWPQQQHTITDTFLEKSFAQRAGLGEPEPHVCSASLKSAPFLWSGCLQQRPRLFLDLQLLKKALQRPRGSSHLGHLCPAAAFSPGLGKSPPSWLIALGQWTRGSLAGSQAVWVSPGVLCRVTCGQRRRSVSCRGPRPWREFHGYIMISFKGLTRLDFHLPLEGFPSPVGWCTRFGFWRPREGLGSCRVVTPSSVYPRGSHRRARFLPLIALALCPPTKTKVGILKGWLLVLKSHFDLILGKKSSSCSQKSQMA